MPKTRQHQGQEEFRTIGRTYCFVLWGRTSTALLYPCKFCATSAPPPTVKGSAALSVAVRRHCHGEHRLFGARRILASPRSSWSRQTSPYRRGRPFDVSRRNTTPRSSRSFGISRTSAPLRKSQIRVVEEKPILVLSRPVLGVAPSPRSRTPARSPVTKDLLGRLQPSPGVDPRAIPRHAGEFARGVPGLRRRRVELRHHHGRRSGVFAVRLLHRQQTFTE